MNTSTRIFLVRHGQTDWNMQRRFQGQADIPLNDEGRNQALLAAKWFQAAHATHAFSAIYASDLCRAEETARIIGSAIGLKPQISTDLREINCGEWEGMVAAEIEAAYPGQLARWHAEVDSYSFPGGECLNDVQSRVWRFYEALLGRHGGEDLIITAHGANLLSLVARIFDWNLTTSWNDRSLRWENTGITRLSVQLPDTTHSLDFYNLTEHLSDPE